MSLASKFAKRLDGIAPFRVVEVLDRAKTLEAQGHDIVHMEAGEPDFATAAPIVAAGQQALADGYTHYSQPLGIPALRQALSDYYASEYGLDVPASRIIITPGASGALQLIAALLINPGQGMLLADPGYPCNRNFMRMVGGDGQLVAVGPQDRYQLTAEKAAAAWQDNTVGALVASPANPTGEILTLEQLRDLYELTRQREGVLVVDELYHGLTYGEKASSILEVTDQAFVINSFSKYFGMTGWRLGWMVVPEEAVAPLEKLIQNLFISSPTVAQHAALAAFAPATRAILDERREIFAERRDFLLPALRDLGFGIPNTPAGGFYIYADASRFTDDCQAFCLSMLEQHGLAITPGTDFGDYRCREHIRFSYTTSMDRLAVAVERLSKVLNNGVR